MTTHTTQLKWEEGMAFNAEVNGFQFKLDAASEHGGHEVGPRPKPLLLTALAGCTAMDVVSILRKMREPLKDFGVRVEADLSEGVPAVYTEFRVIYEFSAADGLKEENVRRAVQLSQERYCGVTLMLSKAAPVTYEIHYLPQP